MVSATAVCPKTIWLHGAESGALEYLFSDGVSLLIQQARDASSVMQYITRYIGEGLLPQVSLQGSKIQPSSKTHTYLEHI
jgi:hypothetical protein